MSRENRRNNDVDQYRSEEKLSRENRRNNGMDQYQSEEKLSRENRRNNGLDQYRSEQKLSRENRRNNGLDQYRPDSEMLIDLHVYVLPSDLWRDNLHSAVSNIIHETISAGFIRVSPDVPLVKVRREISQQIGYDTIPRNYVFVRSVGRCFTQVKSRQERELRAKHFTPPLAEAPEMFVLDSVAAANTPNESSSTNDKDEDLGRKRLLELLRSRKRSSSPRKKSPSTPSPPTTRPPPPRRRSPSPVRSTTPPLPVLVPKGTPSVHRRQPSPPPPRSPTPNDPSPPPPPAPARRRSTTPPAKRWTSEPKADVSSQVSDKTGREVASFDPPPPTADSTPSTNDVDNERKRLRQDMRRLRTRRLELERLREELSKRVKQLNASNSLSRTQAREAWKKRYYDEKKKTSPKEEQCTKLRNELETWHRRIAAQLEAARDTGKRIAGHGAHQQADMKIRSTKYEQEIEEMHTKLQNIKLRLTTEIKLRNQAELEMQALKLDLAEKKINAHRTRSTAYHAAAHSNAQDLLLSARTAAALTNTGRASTAGQPGAHPVGRRHPPSSEVAAQIPRR